MHFHAHTHIQCTFTKRHINMAMNAGDRVVVHYTGTFRTSGSVFDSSLTKAEPFAFNLGCGQVIT